MTGSQYVVSLDAEEDKLTIEESKDSLEEHCEAIKSFFEWKDGIMHAEALPPQALMPLVLVSSRLYRSFESLEKMMARLTGILEKGIQSGKNQAVWQDTGTRVWDATTDLPFTYADLALLLWRVDLAIIRHDDNDDLLRLLPRLRFS